MNVSYMAKKLGVSRQTIYNWIKAGYITLDDRHIEGWLAVSSTPTPEKIYAYTHNMVSTSQAAKLYGKSVIYYNTLCRTGHFKSAKKVNNRWLICRDELLEKNIDNL